MSTIYYAPHTGEKIEMRPWSFDDIVSHYAEKGVDITANVRFKGGRILVEGITRESWNDHLVARVLDTRMTIKQRSIRSILCSVLRFSKPVAGELE